MTVWRSQVPVALGVVLLACVGCGTHHLIDASDTLPARKALEEQGLAEVTVSAVRLQGEPPVVARLGPRDLLWMDDEKQEAFRFYRTEVNFGHEVGSGGRIPGPQQPPLVLSHDQILPVSVLSAGAGLCVATLLVRTTIHLASDKRGTGKKVLIPVYGPARYLSRNEHDVLGLFAGESGKFFAMYGMVLLTIVDGVSIGTLIAGFGLIEPLVEVDGPEDVAAASPLTWSLTPTANGGMFVLQY